MCATSQKEGTKWTTVTFWLRPLNISSKIGYGGDTQGSGSSQHQRCSTSSNVLKLSLFNCFVKSVGRVTFATNQSLSAHQPITTNKLWGRKHFPKWKYSIYCIHTARGSGGLGVGICAKYIGDHRLIHWAYLSILSGQLLNQLLQWHQLLPIDQVELLEDKRRGGTLIHKSYVTDSLLQGLMFYPQVWCWLTFTRHL